MISFVHLSDIHFTKWSKGSFDIDSDLRNEIILDIKHNFAGKINNPDFVNITLHNFLQKTSFLDHHQNSLRFAL